MLTPKERARLRSLSNDMKAILQVGKNEITEAGIKQVNDALEARELIKMSVLESSPYTATEAAHIYAEATDSEVVSVIGFKFILYRKNKKNPKI